MCANIGGPQTFLITRELDLYSCRKREERAHTKKQIDRLFALPRAAAAASEKLWNEFKSLLCKIAAASGGGGGRMKTGIFARESGQNLLYTTYVSIYERAYMYLYSFEYMPAALDLYNIRKNRARAFERARLV